MRTVKFEELKIRVLVSDFRIQNGFKERQVGLAFKNIVTWKPFPVKHILLSSR